MLSRPIFWQRMIQPVRQLYSNLSMTPCLLCHTPTQQYGVCAHCQHDLPRIVIACPRCAIPLTSPYHCGHCLTSPPLRYASLSVFSYNPAIKKLISQFKFHQALHLKYFFSAQLAQMVADKVVDTPQLIMPIPLHTSRLRLRGYNQAGEVAKILSKQLQIPLNQTHLQRIKATQSQSQLTLKERKKNLHAAFHCRPFHSNTHIVLIDDVLTTGHTAEAATKALLQQGVSKVSLWTIARATL